MGDTFTFMDIIYASDNKFAMVLTVSIVSLLKTNADTGDLFIHIIDGGLSEENRKALLALAEEYNSRMEFVRTESLTSYTCVNVSCQNKITHAAYFRLFLPEIMPELTRALYIDCDTLVLEDLHPLWETDMEGCAIGAVCEPWGRQMLRLIGKEGSASYFNSGVLLLDLAAWRQENVQQRFVNYIRSVNGCISFEDQGVINAALDKELYRLPAKYNVMTVYYDMGYEGACTLRHAKNPYSRDEITKALEHPVIVHFTNSFASNRPWLEGSSHPYAGMWDDLRAETGFRDAEYWQDNRSRSRKVNRWIYEHLPKPIGIRYVGFINSVVRPYAERIIK